jgi:hypothetical protein
MVIQRSLSIALSCVVSHSKPNECVGGETRRIVRRMLFDTDWMMRLLLGRTEMWICRGFFFG